MSPFPPPSAPTTGETVIGLVTELDDWSGLVNGDIFFKTRNVVGQLPSVGDKVVVDIERVDGSLYKYEARRVQCHSTGQKWALTTAPPPKPLKSILKVKTAPPQSLTAPQASKTGRKRQGSASTTNFDKFKRHRRPSGDVVDNGSYLFGKVSKIIAVVGTSDIPAAVKPRKVFIDENGALRALPDECAAPENSAPSPVEGTTAPRPATATEVTEPATSPTITPAPLAATLNSANYFPTPNFEEGQQSAPNAAVVVNHSTPSSNVEAATTRKERWRKRQALLSDELDQESARRVLEVSLRDSDSEDFLPDPRSPRPSRTPIRRRRRIKRRRSESESRSRSLSRDRARRRFRNPSRSPSPRRRQLDVWEEEAALVRARQEYFKLMAAQLTSFVRVVRQSPRPAQGGGHVAGQEVMAQEGVETEPFDFYRDFDPEEQSF